MNSEERAEGREAVRREDVQTWISKHMLADEDVGGVVKEITTLRQEVERMARMMATVTIRMERVEEEMKRGSNITSNDKVMKFPENASMDKSGEEKK